MIVGPHSTKLPQSWDTESDQLGVPASMASQFESSNGNQAKPQTWNAIFEKLAC